MTENVLWLGTSSDRNPRIPEDQRLPAIVTKRLAEQAGRPLSPVVRVLWPTPEVGPLVDDWLGRYDPVAVVLHVNSFWFTYESVPERVRRMLGPLGGPLANIGLKAAGSPALAENPVFRTGRKAAVRGIGGDLLLSPEESVAVFSDVIRRVAAREDVVLLVRGPLSAHNAAGTERGFRKSARRCAYVHKAVSRLCEKLYVAYMGWDEPPIGSNNPEAKMGDEVHMTAAYHAVQAAEEGEALVAAWRTAHSGR